MGYEIECQCGCCQNACLFLCFRKGYGPWKGILIEVQQGLCRNPLGLRRAVFALWKRVGLLTPKNVYEKDSEMKRGWESRHSISSLTLWQTQRQLQSHQGNCLFSLPKSQMLLLGRISSTAWCLGPVIAIQRTVVGHAGMNAIPASHYSVFFLKKSHFKLNKF